MLLEYKICTPEDDATCFLYESCLESKYRWREALYSNIDSDGTRTILRLTILCLTILRPDNSLPANPSPTFFLKKDGQFFARIVLSRTILHLDNSSLEHFLAQIFTKHSRLSLPDNSSPVQFFMRIILYPDNSLPG
jgi:hypothetical protein